MKIKKQQTLKAKFLDVLMSDSSFIMGGVCKFFDPSQKEFIVGIRLNQMVYDLSVIVLRWRLVLKCLINVRRYRLPILFVGYPIELETLFFLLARRCNLFFIKNGLWLNGLITNNALGLFGYKMKLRQKFVLCTNIKDLKRGFFYRDLSGKRFFTLNFFPKILIVFNSLDNWDCIKEAREVGIPVICFSSTDANMLAGDFFIPLNTFSMVQKIFYYHFLKYVFTLPIKGVKKKRITRSVGFSNKKSYGFKQWKKKK